VPVPTIVPRADHRISRRDIDSEALKVLYRLHEHKHTAYLVGGSVRDLLLGRRPKDFDIGTSAHPYQIKKLFRNCWIIGRRFRLAHIKFGPKTIEVATFRKNVPDTEAAPADDAEGQAVVVASSPEPPAGAQSPIHRDNTFGTPEEDAFRRDFTINGLFYDIGTFSVIDYVGGLADLDARVVRSIGDPRLRFVEDPVRMLRAVVMASRLGFDLDPLVVEAIAEHRGLIATASPSRLLEEYYKILRSGYAEATFRGLGRARLLELITPELKSPPDALWDWLARLDRYRGTFPSAPPSLTNTVLIGALLVPTGILDRPVSGRAGGPDRVDFGMLQVARKDVERLRQIIQMVPRMADPVLPPRVSRVLLHRSAFADALTWLQVFSDAPGLVERWTNMANQANQANQAAPQTTHEEAQHPHPQHATEPVDEGGFPRRRRRRRRRGRRRGGGGNPAPN
jgi:poly(A) polymerase